MPSIICGKGDDYGAGGIARVQVVEDESQRDDGEDKSEGKVEGGDQGDSGSENECAGEKQITITI